MKTAPYNNGDGDAKFPVPADDASFREPLDEQSWDRLMVMPPPLKKYGGFTVTEIQARLFGDREYPYEVLLDMEAIAQLVTKEKARA